MAVPRDNSKIVTPFLPSLVHFAVVKIAIPLFHEFGAELLEAAFTDIQQGNLTVSEEGGEKNRMAKRSLLCISPHLRRRVIEAVHGFDRWLRYISSSFDEVEERNLQFRSDGSLDTFKTIQNLVQNEKVDIVDRFECACSFCLVESVEALWPEMGEAGQAETVGRHQDDIVSFWVGWLGEQPRVSWRQSLRTWLLPRFSSLMENDTALVPTCAALFPLLLPEERQACLELSDHTSLDDLQFCLYTCTKEEEKQIIQRKNFAVLQLYLMWPLQPLFVDIAEKLMQLNSVHKCCFQTLLADILDLKDTYKDFNYADLFEGFLNKSPPHLKESVKEDPELRQKIDAYFEEKERKRKSDQNEPSQKCSKKDSI